MKLLNREEFKFLHAVPKRIFDTQLALWKVGDCNDFGTFELITSNDDTQIGGCDGGNGFASDMFATCLNPGEVYYIQCDGWAGATGTYELRIVEYEDPPLALLGLVQNIACAPPKGEVGENSIFATLPGVDGEAVGTWSGPNEFSSNENFLENVEPGDYTYEITTDCGDTFSETWTVLEAPSILTISADIDYPDCSESADGVIAANPSGGTEPYYYNWSNAESGEFLGEEQEITDLVVGSYFLTLK